MYAHGCSPLCDACLAAKHGVLSGAAKCRAAYYLERRWLPRWVDQPFPGELVDLPSQAARGVSDLASDPRLAALLAADYLAALETHWRRLGELERETAIVRATSVLEHGMRPVRGAVRSSHGAPPVARRRSR